MYRVKYKYLVGSVMLRLKAPRDEDWVSFYEDSPRYRVEQAVINSFRAGKNTKADCYKGFTLYQLSCEFHSEPDYPFKDFNILNYKTIWKDCILSYFSSLNLDIIAENKVLPKHYYHFVYQYYMIKEDQHFISEEAKAEVQKIHDLKVPGSYIYHIRDLLSTL